LAAGNERFGSVGQIGWTSGTVVGSSQKAASGASARERERERKREREREREREKERERERTTFPFISLRVHPHTSDDLISWNALHFFYNALSNYLFDMAKNVLIYSVCDLQRA
jgi:hypothetical protein